MNESRSAAGAKSKQSKGTRRTSRRLGRRFFERPAVQVARDLIGKFIVRRHRGRLISSIIIETEAYRGPDDRASRAFGGRRTKSVEALYRPAGTVYVYLVYGIHWLLNFKAASPNKPQAVLIRGVLSTGDSNRGAIGGPGKVSRFLKVNRSLYGDDVRTSNRIWIEDRGLRMPARLVKKGPRIGIEYAGLYWATKPWRFRIDARTMAEICRKQCHAPDPKL